MTGSSGFIGSVLRNTSNSLFKFRGLKRTSGAISETDLFLDLDSQAVLGTALSDLDALVHLAWSGNPRTSSPTTCTNLENTRRLFEAWAKIKPTSPFIFFSTGGAVYGHSESRRPWVETDRCLPVSPYGIEKLETENTLLNVSASTGCPCIILRASNPFGVVQDEKRGQGFVGIAVNAALNKAPFKLYADPETVRDFIHVSDLRESVLRVVEASIKQNFEPGIYNLGSGVGTSLQQILDTVQSIANTQLSISTASMSSADLDWCVLNCQKLSGALGWTPGISVVEGIRSMIEAGLKR